MENFALDLPRNPTRSVRIGSVTIGGGHPIAVQSMTATHTQDVDATVAQVNELAAAGADVVRIAVDSKKDAEALAEIRRQTTANLSVDLQENYRLAAARRAARRQDPLQPRPPVSPRAREAVAGQGAVPGRRRRRERLRDARRRQLRLGRSGQAGEVSTGDDSLAPDARKRLGALRAARFARLHALLRLAQGFRSGEGDRGQSPLRRRSGPTCRCTWA